MDSWYITYERPIGGVGSALLSITSDGSSLLEISGPVSSIGLPDKQEIGEYRAIIPTEMANSLKSMTLAAIREANKHNEPQLPGTPFLQMGYGIDGNAPDSLGVIPLSVQMPAEITQLQNAILPVMKKLLEYPSNALHGNAQCKSDILPSGKDLELICEFSSTGTDPVIFENPLNPGSGNSTMELWIEKIADNKEHISVDDDDVIIPLTVQQISLLSGLKSDSSACELKPGQKIKFLIRPRRTVYMSSGQYSVVIRYKSNVEDNLSEAGGISGTLRISAGKFTVKQK
ncbi:MAG TPA: hypothetical protein VHP36_07735 [Chitinispirillaceae bacterium]|nr:hypothetical protein [Chitinispirillaceae bacterium]